MSELLGHTGHLYLFSSADVGLSCLHRIPLKLYINVPLGNIGRTGRIVSAGGSFSFMSSSRSVIINCSASVSLKFINSALIVSSIMSISSVAAN